MSSISSYESLTAASGISNGIVRGCSVITKGTVRGHGIVADDKTLDQIKRVADGFSDGVKVKLNHDSDIGAIIGVLRNFRRTSSKLLADLYLFPSSKSFSYVMELIQKIPGDIGLSISFSGAPETVNGVSCARCVDLYSIDLVDMPAANPGGLFTSSVNRRKVLDLTWTEFQALFDGAIASCFTPPELGFAAIVAQKVAGGMKKTAAVEFAIKHHAAEYWEWRRTGGGVL